jgi:competence ComEA-like helix-hairpin-helix protein
VANYDRNDNDTALCDLLTHLRHWADSEGIDFANAIRRADFHYEAEAIQSEPADLAININTAKVIDLATLPGVGHHVALNIELYREAFGPFKHKTDLMNVRGISERVYLGLTDRITV